MKLHNLFTKLAILITILLVNISVSKAQACFDAEIVQEQFNQLTSLATGVATGLTRPGSSLRTDVMIGFTFMGETDGVNQGSVLGPYAYGAIEPKPVNTFYASEGDYPDQIVINWSEEFTGAKVEQFKLFRNGSLLAEFPNTTLEYVDQNVVAGRFYQYSIVASNSKGDSPSRSVIGFINPNGTVTGRVTTVNGRAVFGTDVTLSPTLGTSMKFDGVDDAIKFPQNPALDVSELTLEFWVRVDGNAKGDTPLIIKEANGLSTRGYAVGLRDGTTRLFLSFYNGSEEQTLEGKIPLENRKWHHVAAVFENGKANLIVDGILESEGAVQGAPITTSAPIFVGAVPGLYGKFKGEIDDIRIWNQTRDLLDIRARRNRSVNSSDQDNGLVANWKLDEGTGRKAFDVTSNDIDGELCGCEYISEIPEVLSTGTTDVDGNYVIEAINYGSGTTFSAIPTKTTQIGRSIELDGIDDYADMGDALELNTSFTIEFWAKRDLSGVDQIMFSQGVTQSAGQSLQIGFNAEDKLYFSFSNQDLVSTEAINDLWNHIAVTFDNNNNERIMYVNGQIAGSDFSSDAYQGSGNVHLGKASFASSNFFKGSLDELRVWAEARSQSDIQGARRGSLGTERDNLIAYLQFNEGSEDFTQDLTGLGNGVSFENMQEETAWSIDLPYADDFVHEFEPEARKLTLNNSNTSVDNINFDDLSLIPVSGYVRYNETECFADSVEILVNGNSLTPAVFTDETGKFTVELEPGTTARISPKFKDHSFLPANYEVVDLAQPIANVVFDNMEKRKLEGVVAGGVCLLPIGQTQVTIRSLNGCFERVISTDDTGRFVAESLPPLNMAVLIEHPNPNITNYFAGEESNLIDEDQSVVFMYRENPQLTLSFLDALTKGDKTVLTQNTNHNINLQLREAYINGADTAYCNVDTALVIIQNNMAFQIDDTVQIIDGRALYTFRAGEPNITGDYTLGLSASARDNLDRLSVNNDLRAIVEGIRPRETTFTTRSPDIPFMILHDPPGDGSFAFIESGTTTSTSFSMEIDKGETETSYSLVDLGPEFSISTGLGVETEIEFETVADFESNTSVTRTANSFQEQTFSFTTNETISTSSNDAFVGDEGDVYIGGALNMVYGESDKLTVSDNGDVNVFQDIIIVPEQFATTFIYTESFILNTLIPSLYEVNDLRSARAWESYIADNAFRKQQAQFVRNLSFDAGAEFQYNETTETTTFSSYEISLDIEEEFASRLGIRAQGVGFEAGVSVNTRVSVGAATTGRQSQSQTFGFVLKDDDEGDFFSVDVKTDPVYGSPVLNLVSGASSNPWQPGTSRRDRPGFTIDAIRTVDVAPTDVASFRANLSNDNLDEQREYMLSVNQQTNSNGATIFINGVPVEDGLKFFLPGGTARNVEITAAKGANAYEYSDIEMRFSAAKDTTIYESRNLSFSFYEPCSEINISTPQNGFLLSTNDRDTTQITLFGYDTESSNIRDVQVQYRRAVTAFGKNGLPEIVANEWINIAQLSGSELGQDFTNVDWVTTDLKDGSYQIRAILTCTDDPISNSSEIITGLIDRSAPRVNGLPSPISGVLGPDDQITVEFSETIDNSFINPLEDVLLFNAETDQPIDIDVVVFENGVTITPRVQDVFLENRTLRASVTGIADLAGNELVNPVEWEFLYNRSPVRWDRPLIQSNSFLDNVAVIEAEFKNSGGSPISFQITNIPTWASVSPVAATVSPGTEEIITITLSQLGAGFYETQMIAETSQGDKPLRLRHRVLCGGPEWELNEGDFQQSMNILGKLTIGENESIDEFDRIGAFVNGELRGIGQVEYVPSLDEYQVFMTIYSNQVSGEEVTFQIWDASTCIILDGIEEEVTFSANNLIGDPFSPFEFKAKEQIIQERITNEGWTWISLNAVPADTSPNSVLESLNPSNRDIIRSQTSFSQFTSGAGWIGNLRALETGRMYQVNSSTSSTFRIKGAPLNLALDTITVVPGWNWIGYSPTFTLPINEALASLEPLDGDIIKSQTRFSVYVAGSGWIGNLGTMRPLEGYQIYSDVGGLLNFPTAPLGSVIAKSAKQSEQVIASDDTETEQIPPIEEWEFNPADFEHTMSFIISSYDYDYIETIDSTIYVGAFVNGEVRGVERLYKYDGIDDHLAFLTVYSNEASGEVVTFYLYDSEEEQMYFTGKEAEFESNGVAGSVQSPFIILGYPTSNEEEGYGLPSDYTLFQNYPNPFNGSTVIKFALPQASNVSIDVFNTLGQKVQTLITNEQMKAGFHTVNWNLSGKISSGIYFYRLRAGDQQLIRKMMYLK